MDGDLHVNESVTIPAGELMWRFSRSSGPGGQGVNTADSRVELRFNLITTTAIPDHLKARALARLGARLVEGALIITASAHRAQLDNRRAAAAKLVVTLQRAMAEPPPVRRPTSPSASAIQARIDSKRHRGRLKQDRRDTDNE